MKIVCWQTILMKYHILFFSKIKKDVNLSSAAVVIGALRVNIGLLISSEVTIFLLALKFSIHRYYVNL